ncbi:MAG: glycosyltransferase family 4 protein [Candidatus Poseidoniaceae archaeon]|jgi:glycosyltransferase involved in cell wall biosynthesis|nr:glycosyltransferase family 4 protein [Candidatus Poseidoniaceae archaeon]
MRILLVTRLFPLPTNVARGTFVADHAELLTEMGHEVQILNALPRMLRMNEARRSTMEGVTRAPRNFEHGELKVRVSRHLELPEFPSITAWSASRIKFNWKPDVIICHTLWPVAYTAQALAKRFGIPWIGVVHGYDFDIALKDHRAKRIEALAKSADKLVVVSDSLSRLNSITIPCHVNVDEDWHNPLKPFKGMLRKSKIDILFPADPRRPEKNHLLALRVGEELETRGWKVGITTLKKQPRTIVWDRMISADVCLITSTRESGPLVAREAIVCGCPVVAVDIGDMGEWMDVYPHEVSSLADGVEKVLSEGQEVTLPDRFQASHAIHEWNSLLESL